MSIRSSIGGALSLVLLSVSLPSSAAILSSSAVERAGVSYVKARLTLTGPQILWEGSPVVTTVRSNGRVDFFGVLPADCVGELSDSEHTVNISVVGCVPSNKKRPASIPRSGQSMSYAPGDDGDLQKGVFVAPEARFTDKLNGTVRDNLTGLIWLKDANCRATLFPNPPIPPYEDPAPGELTWESALRFVDDVNAGTYNCGDTSNAGSQQNDWRVPNVREMQSLIDYGRYEPALPGGHPFSNLPSECLGQADSNCHYWGSTSSTPEQPQGGGEAIGAWFVNLADGLIGGNGKSTYKFLFLVRDESE